jgi:hypothetical protein
MPMLNKQICLKCYKQHLEKRDGESLDCETLNMYLNNFDYMWQKGRCICFPIGYYRKYDLTIQGLWHKCLYYTEQLICQDDEEI